MRTLIDAALSRSRTTISLLVLILVTGTIAYITIPKESEPDIAIPIIYVSMSHEGISPEDAERLLVRPMEQELQNVEGVKEMRSTASEGNASVLLEFDAGFDSDKAMDDVRESVDLAKNELPQETDEPVINEVNVALFPVLVVTLSGDINERTLINFARRLRDDIESLPSVLEVDIAGDREEALEAIIDPNVLDSYGINFGEMINFVLNNNRLIAAGSLDADEGRFAVKVPGLLEDLDDMLGVPVKASGDQIVRVADVATLQRNYKDPDSFARLNGQPAISLEVSKRVGKNVIETIEQVREIVESSRPYWPAGLEVTFSQDKSSDIRDMLNDLQNNILSAVLLVMIVVIAALGIRTAGLVGIAIPGSFLSGILIIYAMGLTINMVVLFSLIMAVGMLIDGAIVVTELADRKMSEGMERSEAYAHAAKRMAWPITASTATTLAAFSPLLFWPGVVGEFMKYLPITLLATLGASLIMALIFVPTLGKLVGKPATINNETLTSLAAADQGELSDIKGLTGVYVRFLGRAINHPLITLFVALAILIASYAAYGNYGRGVEFFPDVEPEQAVVHIRARGNLSVYEKDALVRAVEDQILDLDGIRIFYSRAGHNQRGDDLPPDTIGVIQLEFEDWQLRRPAAEIMEDIRQRSRSIAGVLVEVRKPDAGPPVGKPIQIQLSSSFPELLEPAVAELSQLFQQDGGLVDIEDSRPLPGIEWEIKVDREQAARFGADVTSVGNAIKLVTNGINISSYRPVDTDDEIDITVRLPQENRNFDQLDNLRLSTPYGLVPISNFIERQAVAKLGTIERIDSKRVMTVKADVPEGTLVDNKLQELQTRLADSFKLDPRIDLDYKGEDQEQRESQEFLSRAFLVALFVMAIILVTQFNSFYQAFLILTAVVFSTVGVLLGLLVTKQPFGIVMSGIGVIALAGIVVNNNIVLIDTYNVLRSRGFDVRDAVLRTGAQRLRPVLLTTITTILGLLPMVMKLNIDLINREILYGAPSTQWWTQLATAVAGGLAFATLLTLVLTPCLLVLGSRKNKPVSA